MGENSKADYLLKSTASEFVLKKCLVSSSRGHSIFTIRLVTTACAVSELVLVDLAGMERPAQSTKLRETGE